MRALVAGWFSFAEMGATAGDLLARDLACRWLTEAGVEVDVAVAEPFLDGVRWEDADPDDYSTLVFVCGPIGNGPPVTDLLARFAGCRLIGLDLTMLDPLAQWNPFDVLLERDSDRAARPDLAIAAERDPVPVVGLVLIHPQPEYGARDWHERANATVEEVVARRSCARLRIDTRLDVTSSGLRTPDEVLAMFRLPDAVLTTRLHGLVLALRAGVPVVAIDPVEGGAKITRQAAALAWPWCFPGDVSPSVVAAALDECLRPEARALAAAARDGAIRRLEATRQELVDGLLELTPRREV